MQQVSGVWLPDGDTHFAHMLQGAAKFWRRPTYQVDKFLASLPYIRRFQHAVDIGAHCGLWSMVMTRCFANLTAFEPLPHHAECWRKNVIGGNAGLYELALGDGSVDTLKMNAVRENSGLSHVANAGVDVVAKAMDDLQLGPVDFIKCDCEGYESHALKGAERTILRDKPCVLVEQSGNREALDLLLSWGAQLRWAHGPDYCLSWDVT